MKVRKCSGVIPFRIKNDSSFEVLLVRQTSGNGWVFPKGGIEPGLGKKGNALKEAYEESGVIGLIEEKIGKYSFKKSGQKQEVTMYALDVVVECADYPERLNREKMWVDLQTAKSLVNSQELADFLDYFD